MEKYVLQVDYMKQILEKLSKNNRKRNIIILPSHELGSAQAQNFNLTLLPKPQLSPP